MRTCGFRDSSLSEEKYGDTINRHPGTRLRRFTQEGAKDNEFSHPSPLCVGKGQVWVGWERRVPGEGGG